MTFIGLTIMLVYHIIKGAMEQSACLGDGGLHLFDWKVILTLSFRKLITAYMLKPPIKISYWVGWFVLTSTCQE